MQLASKRDADESASSYQRSVKLSHKCGGNNNRAIPCCVHVICVFNVYRSLCFCRYNDTDLHNINHLRHQDVILHTQSEKLSSGPHTSQTAATRQCQTAPRESSDAWAVVEWASEDAASA